MKSCLLLFMCVFFINLLQGINERHQLILQRETPPALLDQSLMKLTQTLFILELVYPRKSKEEQWEQESC